MNQSREDKKYDWSEYQNFASLLAQRPTEKPDSIKRIGENSRDGEMGEKMAVNMAVNKNPINGKKIITTGQRMVGAPMPKTPITSANHATPQAPANNKAEPQKSTFKFAKKGPAQNAQKTTKDNTLNQLELLAAAVDGAGRQAPRVAGRK